MPRGTLLVVGAEPEWFAALAEALSGDDCRLVRACEGDRPPEVAVRCCCELAQGSQSHGHGKKRKAQGNATDPEPVHCGGMPAQCIVLVAEALVIRSQRFLDSTIVHVARF